MAGTEAPDRARPQEVAAYVAGLVRELRIMAERNEMPALAYLLELARLEAEQRATDEEPRFAPTRANRN